MIKIANFVLQYLILIHWLLFRVFIKPIKKSFMLQVSRNKHQINLILRKK